MIKVERHFNTAGPIKYDLHYYVPPLKRFDLDEVMQLLGDQKYFVLHAPRQTGKTTCMLALRDHLNESGDYLAVYRNIENAQTTRDDVESGAHVICQGIASAIDDVVGGKEYFTLAKSILSECEPETAIEEFLSQWAQKAGKPTVLFLDEVDSLAGGTLVTLLRQLRAGYQKRPKGFPSSIVLCGLRDVRDYRINIPGGDIILGGSCFNIRAESLRLGDFTFDEVKALLAEHTKTTEQVFESAAVDKVWHLSQGQPWLVNALAFEVTRKFKDYWKDRTKPITELTIDRAKEAIVGRRDTHIDQLADKLREERVRAVVEPMLACKGWQEFNEDSLQYCIDLGLVSLKHGLPAIANPIYAELLPRQLNDSVQLNFGPLFQPKSYVAADGSLQISKLLEAFQQFYRENSEWANLVAYKEAGHQLLLQAFLQRIVNGGGIIEREYGLGRGRTDLFLRWPLGDGLKVGEPLQKVVIELKMLREKKTLEGIVKEGLSQTAAYADGCGVDEAHLVIFDVRPDKTWDERIFCRQEECEGKKITVWGM